MLPRVTISTGGFELHGAEGDETRLLVHEQLGYSLAIPGRPVIVAPSAAVPTYDVAINLADVPIEFGFRMDEVPTEITAANLLPALISSYASGRAASPDRLDVDWLRGKAAANGGHGAMRANYQLRGDDPMAMEFLAIILKPMPRGFHALHLTIRYRRGEFTPFAWSNLRWALLFSQSWGPGRLASTALWPEQPVLLQPSAKFELTEHASREARIKAEQVGSVSSAESEQLARVLLEWTNKPAPPIWDCPEDVEMEVSREIVQAVPSRVADVLLRNLGEAKTLHDFRGWLWQCYWAVGNRAEVRN